MLHFVYFFILTGPLLLHSTELGVHDVANLVCYFIVINQVSGLNQTHYNYLQVYNLKQMTLQSSSLTDKTLVERGMEYYF